MKIIVNDKMQQGYSYELSEPEGKNFAPDFRPELSPQQILELRTAGKNFRPTGLRMPGFLRLVPMPKKIASA